MLPPHRTEMLGSEVSRRRRVVILQLRCSDRTEVMGHVRASRHASVRHHVLIASSLGLVAQGNQSIRAAFAKVDASATSSPARRDSRAKMRWPGARRR